jgi:uncharacterized protein YecE (DUF72 family)
VGIQIANREPRIVIGTSGWSYPHWHGVLYPPDLPTTQRLDHYVRRFQTAELNASFYRWPADAVFASWSRRLPDGFVLSVKAPRGLTHGRRLYGPEAWVTRISRGMTRLGARRGVLLVQLPPAMPYDRERLAYFLSCVPRGLRLCLEFRHPSWHHDETFALLEQYGAAYCVMSGAHLPCIVRATADFVYVRLHGPDHHHLYGGSYGDGDLRWWADRIAEWRTMSRDVFAYFNNDGAGNAVRNALTLRDMVNA